MPKSSKKKTGTLKKKLWKLTSELVRREHADHVGYASCVTCGTTKHYKELQAGHFIPKKKGNSIYFERSNIHPQCYQCNINLGSNGPEYFRYMQKRYGDDEIERLRELAKTQVKFTVSDYEEMIEEVEKELNSLESAL